MILTYMQWTFSVKKIKNKKDVHGKHQTMYMRNSSHFSN